MRDYLKQSKASGFYYHDDTVISNQANGFPISQGQAGRSFLPSKIQGGGSISYTSHFNNPNLYGNKALYGNVAKGLSKDLGVEYE